MDGKTIEHEICELVDDIFSMHSEITERWCEYREREGIVKFNQKSTKISDLSGKQESMDAIIRYANFLSGIQSIRGFDCRKEGIVINSRVKNINSIQEKYDDYLHYHPEKGKIQVNKCFNDLFGVRMIIDCDDLLTDSIKDMLGDYGNAVEVHDKNSNRYVATHLYFKKNNYEFKWELQIWKSMDERTNQESHKTHRYKYKGWELEASGCDKTLHHTE